MREEAGRKQPKPAERCDKLMMKISCYISNDNRKAG
jgi:hypothetical protein